MSITIADLMTLQSYGLNRQGHKQRLMKHRRERSLTLGPCMRLQFEDELTVRYQIQEVLHAERVDGNDEVQHEIDTYTHLVPDGSNWKATLLIELPDVDHPEAQQHQHQLPQLSEAAHHLYIDVPHSPRVFAQANEDLPDRHLTRPSAVHFLRFEFALPQRAALLTGATAMLGCAHDQYAFRRNIPPALMARLRHDLANPTHRLGAKALATASPASAPDLAPVEANTSTAH